MAGNKVMEEQYYKLAHVDFKVKLTNWLTLASGYLRQKHISWHMLIKCNGDKSYKLTYALYKGSQRLSGR